MATPLHSTMAPPPTASPHGAKKPGFLKRHLLHHKQDNPPPLSNPPAPTSRPQTATSSLATQDPPPPTPDSAARNESIETHFDLTKSASDETDLTKATSNDTDISIDSTGVAVVLDPPQDPPRQGSRTSGGGGGVGVKFAPGLDVPPQPQHKRTSSNGTSRRGSIFFRIEGSYIDGVDAGVGSKARRLSLAVAEEFRVGECPLAEHFSLLSRAGKKDIGEGGAAVVRLMQSKTAGAGSSSRLFAVKEFREWEPEDEREYEYERKIKSEYAIAKSCMHPNIVETFQLCFSDKKWFHVMEYCELGDLNDLIARGYFSREDRNCMFKQLLRGVEYLHSRGIAHRDLKSENLLLSKAGCLKIADFGTAEVFSGTHPGFLGCRRKSETKEGDEIRLCAPGMVGSRPYMAPEIIKHQERYDPRAVDVWSCAIVYLTLCIGGTPWECASTDVRNYNIFCSTWDAWLEKYPDGIIQTGRPLPQFAATRQFQMLDDVGTKNLMMGMLHPDASKRWSAKDALESKTVTEYPCCQQEGYSDDIKKRQRKALHNHVPPKAAAKGTKSLKSK